jgi:hypothetical protein
MKKRTIRGAAMAAGLLAELAFLLLVAPPAVLHPRGSGEVLFYDRGVVSFTKPEYSGYGSASAGMYGTFVDFVSLLGFKARVIHDIPDSLDGVYALVLTNLDHEMPPGVRERIWDFVAQGGNLFFLGDHTFIKNGTNSLNTFLEPSSIRFRNDSAKNLVPGWFEAYDIRLSQPFPALDNDAHNSLGLLVGASLEITPPAEPLILGRYGFADLGTDTADDSKGHLGDYRFTRNERLGDLVLVAAQRYGRGRLIVFGDTTSFFNGNTSSTYRFIQAVFTSFRAHPLGGSARPGLVLPLAALCLGIGLVVLHRFERAAAVPCALGLVLVYALIWQAGLRLQPFDPAAARTRLALVDTAHNPCVSRHGGMEDSLNGLKVNLMRHGLLPLTVDIWDPALLRSSNCLFVVAPQRRFSATEIAEVQSFVSDGGSVVLACGHENGAGSAALLAAFGLEVTNEPVGRTFEGQAFGSPVSLYSSWAVAVRSPAAEVLTEAGGKPLIVAVPWGKGRFVLVSDSGFFLNRNLESDGKYDMNNILFLRHLLDYLKAGGDA